MITDRVPAAAASRRDFEKSDALASIPLPPAETVQPLARAVAEATETGTATAVAAAGTALLTALSNGYQVAPPSLRVLGVRPHRLTEGVCTYQLFGDYTPSTQRIRVWMRTAIREKVTSPKALINVILHELCHHLDATCLGCPHSFHTRGFYSRIDHLYHHVLATPPEARRPLRWIKRGAVWTVDWRQLRRRS